MEIEIILDSYWNGQYKQMREQIQKYGVMMFFYDIFDYMDDHSRYFTDQKKMLRYKRIYRIYYKFGS